MKQIRFYTTSGCHLCEQAHQMLEQLAATHPFEVLLIDIASDEALVERYGIRIPVLSICDGESELGWPFQPADILDLLAEKADS